MFERPRHQKVAKLLRSMDGELLTQAKCYFGGGTAITLKLGEYRESVDINFLCSDKDGYRLLRNAITPPTLGAALRSPVKHLRDVRTQRDKISTFLEVDGVPVRVEFVLEGRIAIDGALDPDLGVPVLARDGMYAEKLLANADPGPLTDEPRPDRLGYHDPGVGPIPPGALKKAEGAYGRSTYDHFDRGLEQLRDDRYRDECLKAMAMTPSLGAGIIATLDEQQSRQSRP
ncbi:MULTISPECIES: nucleotidyl transferase AbiEii/AbiGii toxin family protein [unclassified Rhodanobacter]|uniref:nucleotidyl transferase AbiEii/AbiGii toxin family protein n=1 Tax=unclassified Rhodanobacter TaxID=2621553 RepID=UPI001BDF6D21|nr:MULTISPECIES: nucleotidyl transferase AbiEii/AbiGii toxin family protein [unclassified Rhodanobacter]MBT2143281.1 nucleotidyl transferase AbiEii/AbiGii toxin family protein [Rhodanobacter sp. LX-99]MBT2147645.1 nucleotidyl transferase AbiEii/AbiGii toxin family protein [Rhodanobacter sp. LX-100]